MGELRLRRAAIALLALAAVGATGLAPAEAAPPAASLTPAVLMPQGLVPPLLTSRWYPTRVVVKGRHVVYRTVGWGGKMAALWMDPTLLKFRFIPGTTEPEGTGFRYVDRRPSTWVPHMAAAFNGGFRMSDNVGGYFYNGRLVRRMRVGYGSLVMYTDGTLKVQVWGRDLKSTTGVRAIRQNLPALVWGGRAQTKSTDNEATWGEADAAKWRVIRSAAGMRADGSIIYLYGYDVTPSEMARAMVSMGVRTAVMLDMNQSWPMGFYYDPPRGTDPPAGHRVHAKVYREPDSFYQQFQKDFVVALTP